MMNSKNDRRYTSMEFEAASKHRNVRDKEYQCICIAAQHSAMVNEAHELRETLSDRAIANACDLYATGCFGGKISAQARISLYNSLCEVRDELAEIYQCSPIDAIVFREEMMGIKRDEQEIEQSFTDSVASIPVSAEHMEK